MKSSTFRRTWIAVEFWDCGIVDHRHKTKTTADNCIRKQLNKKPLTPKTVLRERWLQGARAVLSGSTYQDVGKDLGVSGDTVRGHFRRVCRIAIHPSRYSGDIPAYDNVQKMRLQKSFWLTRLSVLEALWAKEDV